MAGTSPAMTSRVDSVSSKPALVDLDLQVLHEARVLLVVLVKQASELLDVAADRFLCLLLETLKHRGIGKGPINFRIEPCGDNVGRSCRHEHTDPLLDYQFLEAQFPIG